ncbi:MAG: Mov34/MPN/PAD-1 family protein [Candidatus Thermoplasmatota archaeon]
MIEPSCFLSLCASAVETYNRECGGFLMGKEGKRQIRGRTRKGLVVHMAYPLQTADRKPSSVAHGNFKAFQRARAAMHALSGLREIAVIGGYHSHPGGRCALSRDDLEFIYYEFERMEREHRHLPMEAWIEIVIAISKRKYASPRSTGGFWRWRDYPLKVGCTLQTSSTVGYAITIGAFWVPRLEAADLAEFLAYDKNTLVREAAVRVPWERSYWA